MDEATARALTDRVGRAAIARAEELAGLPQLSAAERLRRAVPADLAAAALMQVELRRRAVSKLGARAAGLFLTPDGLEQATRASVAERRARRFRAAGVRTVLDLGCGLGVDALAFRDAGLTVVAVERDPVTAILAEANLGVEVIVGDIVEVLPGLLERHPDAAVFADPARRSDVGRVWDVAQFSPPWSVISSLLAGDRLACVKLGPALPERLIPSGVEAEWTSDHGDVVEVALWATPGRAPNDPGAGARAALSLPSGERLVRTGPPPDLAAGPVGRYVYEPDGAMLRAGLLTTVGAQVGAHLIDPHLAYLTGDRATESVWLTRFAVREVMPFKEKALRRWLHDHDVGTVEIKKRGVDVDPAALRRRLKPHGRQHATVLLARTDTGPLAVIADRD